MSTSLEQFEKDIRTWLMTGFEQAGHKMTGKIINDIDIVSKAVVRDFTLEVYMYKYGVYLDQGVSPSRIPYSQGSGRKSSKYIEGLIRYVQARMNISDLKKAKSIAFAIARTQKKKGSPKGTGGRGTNWMTKTLVKHEGDINRFVEEWTAQGMEVVFDNFFSKQQKIFL